MKEQLAIEVLEIKDEAQALCREITADLPEYFGIPKANEHYAVGVLTRVNLAARYNDKFVGLLSLEFPYANNANIYWMGVLKHYHGSGIGTALLTKAQEFLSERGAKSITVETLAPSVCDQNYRKTYEFYSKSGFMPLFDLKPAGYDWNMVYMVKPYLAAPEYSEEGINIRELHAQDINVLVDAFARHQWNKPKEIFDGYLKEQQAGNRQIWVAFFKDELAGYVTLNWRSSYQAFFAHGIPEIMDLNVLPPFRRHGIGTKLMDKAEKSAKQKGLIVGIGVGLYDGYGQAQKLYVQRGYIPDGRGPTYRYATLNYGQSVVVDDDLVLWFTKQLSDIWPHLSITTKGHKY